MSMKRVCSKESAAAGAPPAMGSAIEVVLTAPSESAPLSVTCKPQHGSALDEKHWLTVLPAALATSAGLTDAAPMLRRALAPLVSVPAPFRVVETVRVPLLVIVPLMVRFGMATGFVLYPIFQIAAGRGRKVTPGAWVLFAISALLFIFYPYDRM